MTVQVSLCLFGVNEVKVKENKIRYYIVLERAQGPTLLDCNYADTCFTAARGSVLAGGCTQVPHRTPLYRHCSLAAITPDVLRRYCQRHADALEPADAANVLPQSMPGDFPHPSTTRPMCDLHALALYTHLLPIIL